MIIREAATTTEGTMFREATIMAAGIIFMPLQARSPVPVFRFLRLA